MSLKTAQGMTVGRPATKTYGLKGAINMTRGRPAFRTSGLKGSKGMTRGKPPKEFWGTSSEQYGEVDFEGNVIRTPEQIAKSQPVGGIPIEYYGKTSAEYGQVSPTGVVEKSPQQLFSEYQKPKPSPGKPPKPSDVYYDVSPPMPGPSPITPPSPYSRSDVPQEFWGTSSEQYGEVNLLGQRVSSYSGLSSKSSFLQSLNKIMPSPLGYSFYTPRTKYESSDFLSTPLMTPAKLDAGGKILSYRYYLSSEAKFSQAKGKVFKPVLYQSLAAGIGFGVSAKEYIINLSKLVIAVPSLIYKLDTALYTDPFGTLSKGYSIAKSLPGKIQESAYELGPKVMAEPGYYFGRAAGIVTAPKLFSKGFDIGIQSIKKIGSTYIPPEQVFAPEVLAGQQTFPMASSPESALSQFQAANIGDDLLGAHTTQARFSSQFTVEAGPMGSRLLEDPGLYITPAGKGSPHFLGLMDDAYYEMSLNPFKNLQSSPSVVEVRYSGIERLPPDIIQQPGFAGAAQYLESRAGEGIAFITKRSEIGMRGLSGLGAGTSEIEAVLPVGTQLQQVTPSGIISRIKGFSEYTVIKGKTIPLRLFETTGDLVSTESFINTAKRISSYGADLSSLASGPASYYTPYAPAIGFLPLSSSGPSPSSVPKPQKPTYSLIPEQAKIPGSDSLDISRSISRPLSKPYSLNISPYRPSDYGIENIMPSRYNMPLRPSPIQAPQLSRPTSSRRKSYPSYSIIPRPIESDYRPQSMSYKPPKLSFISQPPYSRPPVRPPSLKSSISYPPSRPPTMLPPPSPPSYKQTAPKKQTRKSKKPDDLVIFNPKYMPSLKASLLNIKGPKPGRLAIAAGLGTRPLLRGL